MHKIIFFILAFALLLSDPSYSSYSTDRIHDDFMTMLDNPKSFSAHTNSFETFLTRPFATGEEKDLKFFSSPQTSRTKWNQKYQTHSKTSTEMRAQGIFETTGTIFRGLLNSEDDDYDNIVNAAADGMLSALKGDLGFREKPLSATEKRNAIRETLNLGRWMGGNVARKIQDLELEYIRRYYKPRLKKHFQMCALYLLAGSNSEIKNDEWYLKGISDKINVLKKVRDYAQELLPADEEDDVVAAPFIPFDPNTTPITALTYKGAPQEFFGTPGIQASLLHTNTTRNYARYPNVMVLGSLKEPNQMKNKTFSITLQIDPHHYFVIMAPSDGQVALLPAYMMQGVDSAGEEISGNLKVKILSSRGDVSLNKNKVHWSTKPKNNTGLLSIKSPLQADRMPTYSFIASVKRPKIKREILYYFWHPTTLQMDQLKGFTALNPRFTFNSLYDELQRKNATDYLIPDVILDEIAALKDRRLANFSDK